MVLSKYLSLQIAGHVDGVNILKMLRHRRRCLERAFDGLGEHGAVEIETSPIGVEKVQTELMSLLSALLVELDRMSVNCKLTLSKLNRTARTLTRQELELLPSSTLRRANAFAFESERNQKSQTTFESPSECNHQHVLRYTTSNIQVDWFKMCFLWLRDEIWFVTYGHVINAKTLYSFSYLLNSTQCIKQFNKKSIFAK